MPGGILLPLLPCLTLVAMAHPGAQPHGSMFQADCVPSKNTGHWQVTEWLLAVGLHVGLQWAGHELDR